MVHNIQCLEHFKRFGMLELFEGKNVTYLY